MDFEISLTLEKDIFISFKPSKCNAINLLLVEITKLMSLFIHLQNVISYIAYIKLLAMLK